MAQNVINTPYTREEKIAIAIDIGTTHSAVSFSYLCPGENPVIRLVTKWPGQPEASGDSKVPTLVAYRNGSPVAYGAEALEFADDEDHEVAQWFKLHLHPESMKISDLPPPYDSSSDFSSSIEIPNLPKTVTLTQVYADFLKYLYQCTRDFFEKSTPNGPQVWNRLHRIASFVICIPNGWDIAQQMLLRKAAITAGIFSKEDADLRLEFITEGEASVHYALAYTNSTKWLQKDTVFAVMDAGGSTVDSTLYTCKETAPTLVLEEVCSSECVQSGGVFVDRAARLMLEMKLRNSSFNDESLIQLMVNEFEKKTKRIFDGTQNSNIIHFGRSTDNDRPNGIIKGRLSLTSNEVTQAFDDVLERIAHSILKLLSERKAQHLLLVGGFGESPLLRNFLRDRLEQQATEVIVIDEPSKKAAAEGAMQWYIKRLVIARAMRFTVGTLVNKEFDPSLPGYEERHHLTFKYAGDSLILTDVFDEWLRKDVVINQDVLLEKPYCKRFISKPEDLSTFEVPVYAWYSREPLYWAADLQGQLIKGIRLLCTLKADMSEVFPTPLSIRGSPTFWQVKIKIIIEFGGTQLKARLQWNEGDQVYHGPAAILPGSVY